MLWRVMLRATAEALIINALQAAGATVSVSTSKDTPVTADRSELSVYVDEEKEGIGGGAPEFRTHGHVTIEIRAQGSSKQQAEALLDQFCEIIYDTLFGTRGANIVCQCTKGQPTVIPTALVGVFVGALVTGAKGLLPRGRDVAVQAVNADNSVTLTAPFCGATGNYLLNFGNFVGLFEPPIQKVATDTDYEGTKGSKHIASASIAIVGHTTEIFEPPCPPDFTGMNIYIDAINIFDKESNFPGQEPFAVAPAPRQSGPDGRPEIVGSVDLSR